MEYISTFEFGDIYGLWRIGILRHAQDKGIRNYCECIEFIISSSKSLKYEIILARARTILNS